MNNEKTIRNFTFNDLEARATNNGSDQTLEGHAAVFNATTNIGGMFDEVIAMDAFTNCDFTDVPLLVNHNDRKIPLARSRRNNGNSTMQLSIDEKGLKMRADLDTVNNTDSKNLYSAVKRGDISGMSFAFHVADAKWENLDTDNPLRTILKIDKIFDVSAVNDPAYIQTDIAARAKETLDSAKSLLDSERAKALEKANAVDIQKLKNEILAKGEF